MMFTGTLIEDLIATVDRVQQRAEAEVMMMEVELWLSVGQESASGDTQFLGVA